MNPSAAATFIGASHATHPDPHWFCRFLRREIIQVVWLPSPAGRNGEWIVIRVVDGDLRGDRHGGILGGREGWHCGGRRGLFGGKHGQGFPSHKRPLPPPPPR